MISRLSLLCLFASAAAAHGQSASDAHGDPLPAHALMRFGSTKPHHVWPITALAYAPDGKTIASCDERSVRIWDIATGKQLQVHRDPHLQSLAVLAYSADGKWLAAGGSGWTTIYDVARGKVQAKLERLYTAVRFATFTPDGRFLLAGDDKRFRQWDVRTGEFVRVFPAVEGFDNSMIALSASPDGKGAIALDWRGKARWWDLETGKALRETELKIGHRVSFSPDGRWLVASTADRGRPLDGAMICIDIESGKTVGNFPDGDWRAWPHISPDSRFLAGPEGPNLCLWRLSDSEKIASVPRKHDHTPTLVIAPDATSFAYGHGCQIFITDWATGKVRTIGKEPQGIESVSFTRDGKAGQLLSSLSESELCCRQWNLATGEETSASLTLPGRFYAEHVADHLLAGAADGDIGLWDVTSRKKILTLPTGGDPRSPMRFSPDRSLFAAFFYKDGPRDGPDRSAVRVWDAKSGKEVRTLDVTALHLRTMAFTPDGESLALSCGGWHRGADEPRVDLLIWDLKTGKLRSRKLAGLLDGTEIAMSPDGRLLAVSSMYVNCTPIYMGIYVYEIASGRTLWHVREGRGGRYHDNLQFSRDGRTLIGIQGPDVQLWDAITGKPRARLRGHENWVTSLALSPDGRRLLTSGAESTAVCWDVAELLRQTPKLNPLADAELAACWKALADPDPYIGYGAIAKLRGAPAQAVALLEKSLRAAPGADDAGVARHIAELGHSNFAVRHQATLALEQCGQEILPQLKEKLQEPVALEMKRRLEELCAKLRDMPARADDLQAIRGVAVLEAVGTPKSRQLLEAQADGPANARLTREAQAALRRWR